MKCLSMTQRAGPPSGTRVAAGCALLVLAAGIASAENYALLIGISEYDFASVREGVVELEYADDDAQTLAAILGKEYRVEPLINRQADREGILAAFARLRDRVKEDDSLLVFFAGHGLRDPANGKTYWLTFDTRLELLESNGIRLEHLLQYVNEIKAKRKLLLLDHCFSGDVSFPSLANTAARGPSATPQSASINRGVLIYDELEAQLGGHAAGLAVLAASRAAAFESKRLGHGVFTEALRRSLATREADGVHGDGYLSLGEMIQFIAAELPKLATEEGFQQTLVTYKKDVVDEQDWLLLELPPKSQDAASIRDSYRAQLRDWRTNKWITVETAIECGMALDAWIESLAAKPRDGGQSDPEAALATSTRRVLHVLREHMELAGKRGDAGAKLIAENLEREVREEIQRRAAP